MLILNKLIKNLLDKNQLIYLTFIFILISINISPHYFFNFNLINPENKKLIIDIDFIINIIRFVAPIILTLVLLIKNKNYIKTYFFENKFINIYIFYFIICIISALINFKDIKNNILELYFVIIIPVMIFFIFVSNLNVKKISFIYLLAILFISLLATLFLAHIFFYEEINYLVNLRSAPIFNPDLYILGVNTIKSTGLSRLLLIIYIFLFVKILLKNDYKYTILIILSLLNILIFAFESRTSFYFLIFLNCLIFFSKNYKRLYSKLIIFFFISSVGYFSIFLLNNSFSFNNFFEKTLESRYSLIIKDKDNDIIDKNLNLTEKQKQILSLSNKTSGRTDVWIKLFEKEKTPLIVGYGIERDKNIFGLTISNGAFYSYISGGIAGLLCYFILVLLTIKNIFFFLNKFKKNILNINNFYPITSSIVLIFLVLRSLVETSFMFFGIDMIFFVISNILISNKIQK